MVTWLVARCKLHDSAARLVDLHYVIRSSKSVGDASLSEIISQKDNQRNQPAMISSFSMFGVPCSRFGCFTDVTNFIHLTYRA